MEPRERRPSIPFATGAVGATDLGNLGTAQSIATAINARGQIVGQSQTSSETGHAFFWQSGTMTDIGTLGGSWSYADGISDAGHVVGTSQTASGDEHAFIWQNGTMRDLGTLDQRCSNSQARAVNTAGLVVGQADGGPTCLSRPVVWRNGRAVELGWLAGGDGRMGSAYGINDEGQIVGSSSGSRGYDHAFLWEDGIMHDLGTLGGRTSVAHGINEQGQVVGVSQVPSGRRHAFLWSNGTMRDLGTLTRDEAPESFAQAINDKGEVVGYDGGRAFIWQHGTMTDLNTALSSLAFGINNAGQVVGTSSTIGATALLAVRWTAPPVSGSWATRTPLPSAQRGSATAGANGLLYQIGGNNAAGTALKTVWAFDPGSNSWSTKAPLPAGRQNGNGAAAIGNIIYAAGGQDASGTLTRTLYAYNANANAWSTRASMPVPGGCGGSAVIGGKLYVFSGCKRLSTGSEEHAGMLHRYDPGTNQWTTLRAAPAVHSQPAVAAMNGKLYVAGGRNAHGATRRLDVYDPATNSWSTKAYMPTARFAPAGASVGGKFQVFGGRNDTVYLNRVQAYDPVADTWLPRVPMPTARAELGVGIIGSLAYIVGGRTSTTVLAANERYTP